LFPLTKDVDQFRKVGAGFLLPLLTRDSDLKFSLHCLRFLIGDKYPHIYIRPLSPNFDSDTGKITAQAPHGDYPIQDHCCIEWDEYDKC